MRIFILCLFFAGAALRLYKWSTMSSLAGDEGVQLLTIEHFLHHGQWPIVGEISALDSDNHFLFHNSPAGYYLLTIIYVLGLMTPEGYTFLMMLMSLLQAYLLYKAAEIFFNRRAASIVLLLNLFSATMLYASVWVSQPVLAIFIETLALFFYALYKRDDALSAFWGAIALSILATQLYPPMVLLLPFKATAYVWQLKKLSIKNRQMTHWVAGLSFLALLVPFLIIERKFEGLNSQAIIQFWQQFGNTSSAPPFWTQLANHLSHTLAYIFPELTSYNLLFVGIVIAIASYSIFLWRNGRCTKKYILFVLLSIGPALILSFTPLLSGRAYLFITIPFLFLWVGSFFSALASRLHLIFFGCFFLLLLPSSLQQLQPAASYSHIQRARQVATTISTHFQEKSLALNDIDLLAISEHDPYGWETSLYWYALEKQTKQQSVFIHPQTSKTARVSPTPLQVLYVICHEVSALFSSNTCLQNFEEKIHGIYYGESFVSEGNIGTSQVPIFVMRVVPATTNAGEKMETAR